MDPQEILDSLSERLEIPKETLEGLVSGEKTFDDVSSHIDQKFIARNMAFSDPDIVKGITGKFAKNVTKTLQDGFKLDNEEIKDKKVEEIFQLGLERTSNKLTELETQLKDNNPDERINSLTEELEAERGKTEKLTNDFFEANKKVEDLTNDFTQKLTKRDINDFVKTEKSKIKFDPNADDLKIEGFNSIINKTFDFIKEESGEVVPVSRETGKRVENDNKTGFLNVYDVHLKLAEEKGLLKKNDGGGNPPPAPAPVVATPGVSEPKGTNLRGRTRTMRKQA